MAIDESMFDTRVVERNMRRGLITQKDYQEYLESLEDNEDNAAPIESEFEVGVLEDDEEEGGEDEDE